MFVIAYDISDDRRRTKLFKLLSRYGTPVQESVFECHLTPVEFVRLRQQMETMLEPQEDQVRYYHLCAACATRIHITAASRKSADPIAIVI